MIPTAVDAWPFIDAELGNALRDARLLLFHTDLRGFRSLLEARYRAGERLYEREWLTWDDPSRFDEEAVQELADLVLYLAMRRVRHPNVGT